MKALMNITAALVAVSLVPAAALADDGDGDYAGSYDTYDTNDSDESVAATPRVYGDVIVDNAAVIAAEYNTDGVYYDDVRPLPDGAADCNSYVNTVLNDAGIEMPPTATWELANNPNYERVDAEDAQPGDVIWQPGHMGIYSGTDDDGDPYGYQMGHHGAQELQWGPQSDGGQFAGGDQAAYYRPLQTADYEERIGEDVDELWSTPSTGEWSAGQDMSDAAAELAMPVYTAPIYTAPATISVHSSCSGVCAGAAY